MPFNFSPKATALQWRVRALMDGQVTRNKKRFAAEIAADSQHGEGRTPTQLVDERRPKARPAWLWNLFLPELPHGAGRKNIDHGPLAEQTVWQEHIAEARCMIDQARLPTRKAAQLMDTVVTTAAWGEIAMINVVAPNVACTVFDWTTQAHDGSGCDDFPLALHVGVRPHAPSFRRFRRNPPQRDRQARLTATTEGEHR